MALNAKPYTDAIFDAVQALVAHTHITHPIAVKDEKNPRVAVLALTSDRGMAGPYTSSIIRETELLLSRLDAAGKQPELFVYGRRGSTYYRSNRDIAATWEGDTDQPGVEIAETISNTLMDATRSRLRRVEFPNSTSSTPSSSTWWCRRCACCACCRSKS